jgi:hypothetical protein
MGEVEVMLKAPVPGALPAATWLILIVLSASTIDADRAAPVFAATENVTFPFA